MAIAKVGRVAGRLVQAVGLAIVGAIGLASVCAFTTQVPYFSMFGSILLSTLSPAVIVLFALFGALYAWRWRRTGARTALAGLILCAMAVGGSAAYLGTQLRFAHTQGAAVSLAHAFRPQPAPGPSSSPQRFVYGHFAGQPLEILVYPRANTPAPATPAPVLVYVHGGGWTSLDSTARAADMRWFAQQGFAVFSVGYTLSTPGRPLWNVTEGQVACALAWIGRHASGFGADPGRLALIGESAGGNLVLNAGYSANVGRGSPCRDAPPRVAATVAIYPVVDVASFYDNPDPTIGAFGRRMAATYTGGSPRQVPDRYHAVSSFSHLGRHSPPALVVVGEADHLVPPEPTYAFAAHAAKVGAALTMVHVPFADHGFDGMPGSIPNQMVRQLSLRFLRNNGFAVAAPAAP